MFHVCNNYEAFLLQMLPSETIEQAISWIINLPAVSTFVFKMKKMIRGHPREAVVPVPSMPDDTVHGSTTTVHNHPSLHPPPSDKPPSTSGSAGEARRRSSLLDFREMNAHIGTVIAAKEMGEDLSYILGAFMMLPISQMNVFYSTQVPFDTARSPSYSDIAICLFGFSLLYEHFLSVLGAYLLSKQGVHIKASSIPYFNELSLNEVDRERGTDPRKLISSVGGYTFFLMIAAAAAS